jgi:NADH-quinone oxidoreductase subunit J
MIVDVLLTILTIAFAIMVVFSKKTVVAALALLMTLLTIAIIYFQLGTVFLSAVQVLINAGAIAILFVFVMMLINLDQFTENREKSKLKLTVSAVAVLVIGALLALTLSSNMETISIVNLTDNSMKTLFEKLFDTYYLPFELATVLLLAAIVACIVITTHEKNSAEEVLDMNKSGEK